VGQEVDAIRVFKPMVPCSPGRKLSSPWTRPQRAIKGFIPNLVDYRQMTKTHILDKPEPDGTVALVIAQAGVKMWQLCDLLDDLGYALPLLGGGNWTESRRRNFINRNSRLESSLWFPIQSGSTHASCVC
jgi:hypothetical protein